MNYTYISLLAITTNYSLKIILSYFQQIKINFLMKGHTHEDCDQLFSRFGLKLSKNDVVTVDGELGYDN